MLFVVSPAKSLDFESPVPDLEPSQPRLLKEAQVLAKQLKGFSADQLGELMNLSAKLAELNFQRFQDFKTPLPKDLSQMAVFAFDGDVYGGLDARSLNKAALKRLNQRLRILSGFYGLLKPFDLILPYRLEMGTKLATERGKDLYAFWGEQIRELLAQDMKEAGGGPLVNLASNEYFKAVQAKKLDAEVITPQFKDLKNGEYKMISFFAKKARGLMARYLVEEDIDRPEGLLDFRAQGYRYDPARSKPLAPVFIRDEAP